MNPVVQRWNRPDSGRILAAMSNSARLALTVVAVAVIGFAWAHFGLPKTAATPTPLSRQAAVASFKVDYPAAWTLTPAKPVSRFPLSDEVQLNSGIAPGATLVIGTAHPPDPELLPQRLRAVLPTTASPQVVRLGSLQYLRFLDLAPRDRAVSESVYVLPTTQGTVTGVCASTTPSRPFTAGCERVLASLQLTSGASLSLTTDTGYALALNPILNTLNAARSTDGPGLRAADVAARIRAAIALAAAHASAASAAGSISTSGMSAANPALVSALSLNATAYRSLARAAAHQDQVAYGRAQTALTGARRALTAAYTQLSRFGYTIG